MAEDKTDTIEAPEETTEDTAPEAAVTEDVVEKSEEDFDKAFEDFSEKGEDTNEEMADETAATERGDEEEVEDTPEEAAEEVAEEETAEDETEEVAKDEPVAEPEDNTSEVLERLSKLVADADKQRTEETDKSVTSSNKEEAEEEESFYTPEDEAYLKEYEKDWEDVSKGEALKRRAEYNELVKHIFSEVQKYYAPVEQTLRTLAERAQYADLEQSIPDYDDNLRDNVVSWVDSQPDYLQAAYKEVIQSGTAEQVKDLVSRYKQATGGASTKQKASPKPAKKEPELSDDAKKAAQSLAPVSSKRGAVPKGEDKSNYDDAFSRFSKELKDL